MLDPDPIAHPHDALLTLTRSHDKLAVGNGWSVLDDHAERFWLPIIGPSSLLLLRHVARHTEDGAVYEVLASDLACAVGLGSMARVLERTLSRLHAFHLAQRYAENGHWSLAAHVPPLTAHQLDRLTDALRDEYRLVTA